MFWKFWESSKNICKSFLVRLLAFSFFPATLLMEHCKGGFGKPQMKTLYPETLTFEVLFRYIISFSAAWTFSVCFHWFTLFTALAPLAVSYPLYFIFHIFFLIITATKINAFDAFLSSNSKGFKEFKSGVSFSMKSFSSVPFSFSFFFLSFHFYFPSSCRC